MGVYSVLTSIFFMVAFGGMGAALEHLHGWTVTISGYEIVLPGWRIAWGSVGLVLLVFCVPVILLFVRTQPPVGFGAEKTPESQPELDGIPYSKAIRSGAFWVFALSISFFGLVSSGIGLNNEDILVERGFDAQMYHFLMVLPLPFGLLSNLAIGYLARYVRITHLLAFSLFFTGLAKFLFPFIHTQMQVYAYTVIFALAGGGLTVLFFIAWADLFGKRNVGRIQGIAQMISVFASALGPVFFAYSKEWTDSYTPAFYISGGITILFAIAACLIRIPQNNGKRGQDVAGKIRQIMDDE
jgi:sugar phosphate permease